MIFFAALICFIIAKEAERTVSLPKGAPLFEVAVGQTCSDGWSGCTGWLQYCGKGYTVQGSGQSLDEFCCDTCSGGTPKPTMQPTEAPPSDSGCADAAGFCTSWSSYCGRGYWYSGQSVDDYCCSTCSGQTTTTTTTTTTVDSSGGDNGGSSGDSDAGSFQAVLDRHNVYRCMHGIPLLNWNSEIATNAQNWADSTGGDMVHSSSESRSSIGGFSYLGENLAWGTTSSKAVDLWYDEIDLTSPYGVVTEFTSGIGHYTQVVWRDTTDLGCGVKDSLLVCQYGIGGNMAGDFENNVNAPTKERSECESTSSDDHFLGSCDQCLYTSQCPVDYYCCPYMKKCVKNSSYSCYYPIADCRPTCSESSAGYPDNCTCNNADFPDNWVQKSEESALETENQRLRTANKALRQALKQMQHA